MTIIAIHNATKYYGAAEIFRAVTFQVARGERVALVGTNGSGKSTLLKILANLEGCDSGTVQRTRGLRIAYLAQDVRFAANRTLWEEMLAAFDHIHQLREEIEQLETRIADTSDPNWEPHMQRYADLTARFEHGGGYEIDQRIERMLSGLGFRPQHYHQPLAHLSGGQKMRAALAAVLLSDPDLLLLDEPTNHLDLDALEWLEHLLTTWDQTLMVASHDRSFLNRVTKRTLELSFGGIEDYPAPYDTYLRLKAERLERRLQEYKQQQDYIAKTEEFIRRYKAGQRSKEAQGREKRLERFKAQQMVARPREPSRLKLFMESRLRSGEVVLSLHHLVVGYHTANDHVHVLVRSSDHELYRGERVALLGRNGSGKTTLLRTLLREVPALAGHYHLGHNVVPAYYAQGHERLNHDATVLDEIRRITPMSEEDARTFLGRFLFRGDDVFKQISLLSGGERSRVALAQLTLRPGNLLIMDEPTHHLDISAREALEQVLSEYPGALLFVSHDRAFIDALADKLWVIEDQRLVEYRGGYTDYRTIVNQNLVQVGGAKKETSHASTRPSHDTRQRQRQRQIAALEAQLEQLEQELATVSAELETASAAQDIPAITTLGTRYTQLQTLIDDRYAEWELAIEESS